MKTKHNCYICAGGWGARFSPCVLLGQGSTSPQGPRLVDSVGDSGGVFTPTPALSILYPTLPQDSQSNP